MFVSLSRDKNGGKPFCSRPKLSQLQAKGLGLLYFNLNKLKKIVSTEEYTNGKSDTSLEEEVNSSDSGYRPKTPGTAERRKMFETTE